MKHFEYEINLMVENELPPDKKEKLLLHLAVCKKCRNTLLDYSEIKSNIIGFYNTLPENTKIRLPLTNKIRFSRKVLTPGALIPVSIAASIILAALVFIKPGIHLQKISSFPLAKNETAIGRINKLENFAFHKNRRGSKSIRKKKREIVVDYNNILVFNNVINQAIYLKAKNSLSSGLLSSGKNYDGENFNKVINSVLYNCYNN